MGRQVEKFRDEEKAFLIGQIRNRAVVRDVLLAGEGNFYVIAANLIIAEYEKTFGDPLAPESEKAFKNRRKNAKGQRKAELERKLGETEEEAQARMEGRVKDIKSWLKTNWNRERVRAGLPLPPMTATRRHRRIGALDAFMLSDLKRELSPLTVDKQGKPLLGLDRRRAARIFGGLAPEKIAEFQDEATRMNLERAAEDLVDTDECDEATRAQRVPSAKEWVKGVTAHLHKHVDWLGGAMFGGRGQDGGLDIVNASHGVDSQGRDYIVALCHQIGWTVDQLKAWTAYWFYDAMNG
ncbi:hypothetical protein C8Q76DRAFT_575855, partial [Earliella scabrosa]